MTSQDTSAIAAHYGDDGLGDRLLEALRNAGHDVEALTPDQLKPIDQFHIGGEPATQELASLAGIRSDMRVLDVGGGIGGPARTLASTYGCTVTVLDLTESYCRAGEMLTARTGLSDLVTFQHGDALAIPFPDRAFDLVWTQHSSMNVWDKRRLYAETQRVLRPGGRLALHEIAAGAVQPVHFPVPWARDHHLSFLTSPDALHRLIGDLGFQEVSWRDVTTSGAAWFRTAMQRAAERGDKPALGLRLLLGDIFPEMSLNMLRNLNENRIVILQAVFDRP